MSSRSLIRDDGLLAYWPVWPSPLVARATHDHEPDAARAILWDDTEALDAPFRNSLRVLAALRVTLARVQPLGAAADDFLTRSGAMLEGDEASLRNLWSDPRAYFWTRIAQQLAAACVFGSQLSQTALHVCEAWGETDPARALARHLAAFETHPIEANEGRGPLVSPLPWRLPGLAAAAPVLRAGAAFHERQRALVSRALDAIERHLPEAFECFLRRIRFIGLLPPDPGRNHDWSEPELPGSFIARAIPHPLELADHFIHELQHNRLSCIEECGPFFDAAAGDALHDARHFSPWRDKPRALYGIFHGIYVFVAVGRFWLRVHEAQEISPADRAYAVDRLLRTPRQLALAVAVVRHAARFTPLGLALFEQLVRDVHGLSEEIAGAGLPADAPALAVDATGRVVAETDPLAGRPRSVRDSLLDHLQRNDSERRCAGLVKDLAW